MADISFIMNFLNLKPGMSMIESGTGSGSFSHSIARTLAPTGHLYSFEYHQERVNAATKEFEDHGLSDMITLRRRDVCKDGFDLVDRVDAGIFFVINIPFRFYCSFVRELMLTPSSHLFLIFSTFSFFGSPRSLGGGRICQTSFHEEQDWQDLHI